MMHDKVRVELEVNKGFDLEQRDQDRGYRDGDEDALGDGGVSEACDHLDCITSLFVPAVK